MAANRHQFAIGVNEVGVLFVSGFVLNSQRLASESIANNGLLTASSLVKAMCFTGAAPLATASCRRPFEGVLLPEREGRDDDSPADGLEDTIVLLATKQRNDSEAVAKGCWVVMVQERNRDRMGSGSLSIQGWSALEQEKKKGRDGE